jgi:adenylylsulfate kinase
VPIDIEPAFAIWITGLPASGKSTITRELRAKLALGGIHVAVLESDELRKVLTPNPTYDTNERETFYNQMVGIGAILVRQGVPVIFDATANRRIWREQARAQVARFLEVFVDAPLELCMARDPKGIYRRAQEGGNTSVPGLQADYEKPENPDITVHAAEESADVAADRIVSRLAEQSNRDRLRYSAQWSRRKRIIS